MKRQAVIFVLALALLIAGSLGIAMATTYTGHAHALCQFEGDPTWYTCPESEMFDFWMNVHDDTTGWECHTQADGGYPCNLYDNHYYRWNFYLYPLNCRCYGSTCSGVWGYPDGNKSATGKFLCTTEP